MFFGCMVQVRTGGGGDAGITKATPGMDPMNIRVHLATDQNLRLKMVHVAPNKNVHSLLHCPLRPEARGRKQVGARG
jgi:hypothetical protein